MASNRVDSISSAAAAPAATPESTVATATATAQAAPSTEPAAPVDRVTLTEVGQIKTSVTMRISMAALERSDRLEHLAQAVRAGAYRLNASQLAEQILADAELDARIAKSM